MEQSPIRITFTPNLIAGTVEPSAPQYAGVQGDHRAAQVAFIVPESMRGDAFRYRIDGLDGAGGYVTSGLLPMDADGVVCFLLPAAFTQAGGQLLVRLVVSELADGEEIGTVHSFDGRLYFADAPGPMDDSLLRGSIAAMLAEVQALIDRVPEMCEAKWLSGEAAPSETTTGAIGQFYRDTLNGAVYECLGETDGRFRWVKLIRQSDIATAASPGVVAVSHQGNGGLEVDGGGLLSVCSATQADIDAGAEGAHSKRPITPENLDYAMRGKADAAIDAVATLIPPNWDGESAPYQYELTVPGMTPDKKIFVCADASMNAVKREQMRQALITCKRQDVDMLTFVADGVKPTQSLSVLIREVS